MISSIGLKYINKHSNNITKKRFFYIRKKLLEVDSTNIIESTQEEVNAFAVQANRVFPIFKEQSLERRAILLETIAEEISNLGDTLIKTCHVETCLPLTRLLGERTRTCNQLKMFSNVLREKSFLNTKIDFSDSTRVPIPKPDTRLTKTPIGPVAVFGASNFPLAFSVAGNDTASALAAGCPVIFKVHPSHVNTSKLVASAIRKSLIKCELPEGVFQLVGNVRNQLGISLVQHPFIQAVGFTGSQSAGLALLEAVQKRPIPIPIFAEMGSSNPMFLLPGSFETEEKANTLANELVNSINLGVGQFCTKPGVLFCLKDNSSDILFSKMETLIKKSTAGKMLNSKILKTYRSKLEEVERKEYNLLTKCHSKHQDLSKNLGIPHLFKIKAKEFLIHDKLEHEIFGPSSIFFHCETMTEMLRCALKLNGHLTVSIHGEKEDLKKNKELFDILLQKAGRIIINGFPTGVEVNQSMVHGGPFPASTDSRTTSVGATAIDRFLRPICFQNVPSSLLPLELKQ